MRPLERAPGDVPLPLSFTQERLWLLGHVQRDASLAYHVPAAIRLRGPLDSDALKAALERLFARHGSLRTRFSMKDGCVAQEILPEDAGFPLRTDTAPADTPQAIEALLVAEASKRFDLENGLPVRGLLLEIGNRDHVLLITMHHIVTDGFSMAVFFKELGSLYSAFSRGEADPLAPLAVQYADYAWSQRTAASVERHREQGEYWKRALEGAPGLLTLQTDRPRPATQRYTGAELPIELEERLVASLIALSRRHRCTLFVTVLAGWAALLSRLSGQDDVVVGVPVANRRHVETEAMIGAFVNTLPIRISFAARPSTAEVLAQVRQRTIEAQAYGDIPFEQIVALLAPERTLAYSPIFQAMVAWQNMIDPTRQIFSGLEFEPVKVSVGATQFDLVLSLKEEAGRISGSLTYATDLFERTTVERYLKYWTTCLEGMIALPDVPVAEIDLLSKEEMRLLQERWKGTQEEYPRDALIQALFEEQVRKHPHAVGIEYEGLELTYAQVNERANRLAHRLIGQGIGPDDVVGVCAQRGVHMVLALLGVLKSGGAYLPLEPGYPAGRLQEMIDDASPHVILADDVGEEALKRCAGQSRKVVGLAGLSASEEGREWRTYSSADPDSKRLGLTSKHLAYVIYTSGSTGVPKGAQNEHRGLVNRLTWMQRAYCLDETDRVLQKTPFSFDVSVWEFFWPLISGARLVVARPDSHGDPGYLSALIETAGITTVHFVPSMLAAFVDRGGTARCASLRRVICSGEMLSAKLVRECRRRLPDARLYNLYGPTETAVDVTAWSCPHVFEGEVVPIGRPIANTAVYILDRQLRPVPAGVPGELCIGGVQVGRGYLNRAELTEQRFVTDPHGSESGARMYRTGDLGRYLPDGNIEFLGRNDEQAKIRGIRIEPGEIEARLNGHPGVREAVVLVRADEQGEKRLVAYCTARDAESVTAEKLRDYLAATLPEYMVPSAFVRLESFPVTSNGKLDRRRLPAPVWEAYARGENEDPRGEVEEVLAGLWQELLGSGRVNRNDNFFCLGGHSLLAVRLMARVARLCGVELPISEIFKSPTLRSFAKAVQERKQGGQEQGRTISAISREGQLPLSYSQRRLWFLSQLPGVSETYHIPCALRLHGRLHAKALKRALDRLYERHEALRTVVEAAGGDAYARILPADGGFYLCEQDLRGESIGAERLREIIYREARSAFDLERGPLIRGRLIHLAEEEHLLMLTQHHIVSDGWSQAVLLTELADSYNAYSRGDPDSLPQLGIQYADYAAWQREWLSGAGLQGQEEYWRRQLAGAPPELIVPTDHALPETRRYEGGTVEARVSLELVRGLRELSVSEGGTLFMALLAGWAAVLSRLGGQEEVVIGSPIANRGRMETHGLVGLFVNTLALRVGLSGEPSVRELIGRVRAAVLGGQDNQDLPFERVVEILHPPRRMNRMPMFQALFVWQEDPINEPKLQGLRVEAVDTGYNVAKFDLQMELVEREGEVVGQIRYAKDLFGHGTMERHCGYFLAMLEGMIADPSRRVRDIEMMSDWERDLVLKTWNEILY